MNAVKCVIHTLTLAKALHEVNILRALVFEALPAVCEKGGAGMSLGAV